MSAPLPIPGPLFAGPILSELLGDRTARAVATAQTISRADEATLDVAARIVANFDVTSARVTWDAPTVTHTATGAQTMQSVTRWPVEGNVAALTWAPERRSITGPPVVVGLSSRGLVTIVEARRVNAGDVIAAQARARRFVDEHLEHIDAQLTAWRADMSRRVRDAVRARRALLDSVSKLSASAALEAIAVASGDISPHAHSTTHETEA